MSRSVLISFAGPESLKLFLEIPELFISTSKYPKSFSILVVAFLVVSWDMSQERASEYSLQVYPPYQLRRKTVVLFSRISASRVS